MNLNIFKKIGNNVQLRHCMNELQQDSIKIENILSQLWSNAENTNNQDFIYLFNILYGCLNNCLIEKNYQFDFPIPYVEKLMARKKIDNFKITGEVNIIKDITQNIFNKENITLEIWNKNFWVKRNGYTTKIGKINNKEIEFNQVIETLSETHFQFMKVMNFHDLFNKVILDSIKDDEIKNLLNMTNNKQFNTLLILFSPPQTKFKILNMLHKNHNIHSIDIEKEVHLIKELFNEWEKEDYGRYEEVSTIKRIVKSIPVEQIKEEINKFLLKEELLKDLNQLKDYSANKVKTRKI